MLLPVLSLGLWHNFGAEDDFAVAEAVVSEAFERGIVHFDLADNYGPPPGAAETTFGRLLKGPLRGRRDQILIATKAGHLMWEGPYGDWASRKHLVAGCDQSLRRLGVDYVDIFYSHRPDPETPPEETAAALDHLVRSGRALYIGLSKYPPAEADRMMSLLAELGTPCVVHQLRYSLLVREPEAELFPLFQRRCKGCVTFSPLAQGQLSDRYAAGIPAGSRAARSPFLKPADVQANHDKVQALAAIARQRGESLAQMALAWQMARPGVTSVIVGVSSVEQLRQNLGALESPAFTAEQLAEIDRITGSRPGGSPQA